MKICLVLWKNLKVLPSETKIYCGHEYTKTNLDFCLKYDPNNTALKEKSIEINSRLKKKSQLYQPLLGEEKN